MTDKKKTRVDYEPRSAHGRAVNKPRVEHEPRSAHGRAVKKNKPWADYEPPSARLIRIFFCCLAQLLEWRKEATVAHNT